MLRMKFSKRFRTVGVAISLIATGLAVFYFAMDREHLVLDDRVREKTEGSFIRLSQGMVHYELNGPSDGPTVVLVHGFSTPYYIWDPTFEALCHVGYRVLRFDLYGRGYSDRPNAVYNLDFFVNQLSEMTDAMQLRAPFHLAGVSMGGPIATAYAIQHPSKVQSVVLIDPFMEPMSTASLFPLTVPWIGEYFAATVLLPLILPKSQMKDFHRPERFPDWIDKYSVQMQYEGYSRAILSTMRNLIHTLDPLPLYKTLGVSDIPILLFRGESDQSMSWEQAKTLRMLIPRAQFVEIKEAGHLPHYERPEVVNPIVTEFLAINRNRQSN